MRHLTCDPDVEVIGANMLSIINNLQREEIFPLLEKHNLTDIEPEEWYPASKWLSVMNDLAAAPNMSMNFVAIGMKIPEHIILPPELQNATLPQILEMWDVIYHMQHRGGDIGNYVIEQLTEKHYRCTYNGIYPDDLNYGVSFGFCRRFLPQGIQYTVKYEEIDNRLDQGENDETVILFQWE